MPTTGAMCQFGCRIGTGRGPSEASPSMGMLLQVGVTPPENSNHHLLLFAQQGSRYPVGLLAKASFQLSVAVEFAKSCTLQVVGQHDLTEEALIGGPPPSLLLDSDTESMLRDGVVQHLACETVQIKLLG